MQIVAYCIMGERFSQYDVTANVAKLASTKQPNSQAFDEDGR